MRFFSHATTILGIVLRIIWLAFALVLWVVGIVGFVNEVSIGNWLIWGVLCAIPLCVRVLRGAFSSAREGAERGSREYTVSYSSFTDSYEVRNNSGSGCLWGFLGGLIGGVAVGPVVLPLYFFGMTVTVVGDITAYIRGR